jgi:NAD(P)-dependent dehydrogenase (short-subunit alcohol dehydrogenase family)
VTRTIVVTGGSRGIGAATARLAGQRGWSVVINYRGNRAAADETAAAVVAAGGHAAVARGDVTDEAAVVALFDTAIDAFGAVDGVVNNAGILVAPPQPLADMSHQRLMTVVEVNLVGAMLVAREAIRRMATSRGGKGGAIVNISSAAARLGAAGEYVDYAATKGGLDTLTTGLSREVAAEGIRVNAVRPGLIETDIHASGGDPERLGRVASSVPMRRAGSADEVAAAVVWLLSDAASYVNGAILDVTGGR